MSTTRDPFDFPDKYTHLADWNAHIEAILHAKYFAPDANPTRWNEDHPDDEALALSGPANKPAAILAATVLSERLRFQTKQVVGLCWDAVVRGGFVARWSALTQVERERLVLEGLARAAGEAQRVRIRLYCPAMRVEPLAGLRGDKEEPENENKEITLLEHIKRLIAMHTVDLSSTIYMFFSRSEAYEFGADAMESLANEGSNMDNLGGTGLIMLDRAVYTLKTVKNILFAFYGKAPDVNDPATELIFRARYDLHVCQYEPCKFIGAKNKCGGCHQMTYCSRECQAKAWPGHKKSCGANATGKWANIVTMVPQNSVGGLPIPN
ncbi:hypothetical protein MKEN_00288100 [Mycena kentingensis (nom. inval.)]|nr:hypothetical protein MKEN_00288100 [Mycena kentingensis (nom. inval.)]